MTTATYPVSREIVDLYESLGFFVTTTEELSEYDGEFYAGNTDTNASIQADEGGSVRYKHIELVCLGQADDGRIKIAPGPDHPLDREFAPGAYEEAAKYAAEIILR